MKASELLVRSLENEGVRYIFGMPGEENLEFMEALSHSTQITFVTTRHEQGAAFMANVYGPPSSTSSGCQSSRPLWAKSRSITGMHSPNRQWVCARQPCMRVP